eukprot:gene16335-19387_t
MDRINTRNKAGADARSEVVELWQLPEACKETHVLGNGRVPAKVVSDFIGRLERKAEVVQNFRELKSPEGMRTVGQCASAAHFLQHSLEGLVEEPQFLDLLQGMSEAEAEAGLQEEIFGTMLATLEEFWRNWVDKLAAAATQHITEALAGYCALLAPFEEEEEEGPGELSVSSEVSPALCPTLDAIRVHLQMLHEVLDRGGFSKAWRLLAAGIRKHLLSSLALEARFSRTGAVKFQVDCDAITSIFKPYTPRPAKFFQELKEVCILAGLDHSGAQQVRESLPDLQNSILRDLGVCKLNSTQ